MSGDDLDLEELLAEVRAILEKRRNKRENPYVIDLIEVLSPHNDGLERHHVIRDVEKLRRKKNLPIPEKLEETIQSTFQGYSSQYAAFRRGADLFYSPGGKGSGIWGVHLDRARAWLSTRRKA